MKVIIILVYTLLFASYSHQLSNENLEYVDNTYTGYDAEDDTEIAYSLVSSNEEADDSIGEPDTVTDFISATASTTEAEDIILIRDESNKDIDYFHPMLVILAVVSIACAIMILVVAGALIFWGIKVCYIRYKRRQLQPKDDVEAQTGIYTRINVEEINLVDGADLPAIELTS